MFQGFIVLACLEGKSYCLGLGLGLGLEGQCLGLGLVKTVLVTSLAVCDLFATYPKT